MAVRVTPPALAVIVTGVDAVTALVAIAKVVLVAPCGTDTPAGTVAAALPLDRETAKPPAGAGDVTMTVPCAEEPPVTLVGLTDTVESDAGGVTRSAALTVNPQPQTATLTVTATGRSGERVTSNPAGINVMVGSSGSASFATGTTVTLSATNSRDVVWSGACSSGGNKTKTCTFTLNGNAAVTANVQ